VAAIFRSLTDGGVFIQDIRNPEHPRTQAVTGDWERWSERDGVFRLERHFDTEDGIHHDVWIEIDTINDSIIERTSECKASGQDEVFRVLKPGGRMAVSDIVTDGPLPDNIKSSLSAWAGCIAGALDIQDYRSALGRAGFTDIEVTPSYFDEAIIDEAVREMGDVVNLKVISRESLSRTVFSARITAGKP
jgi:hypothetical protein